MVIFVHTLPNNLNFHEAAFIGRDSTAGDITVTNVEIESIWCLVIYGTPIEILY